MRIKEEIDIIIVFPYRFREFDRLRFEIECLKKEANVVIYELLDVLYPHFSSAYHTHDNDGDIERFVSLSDWRTVYENKVASSNQKPYVINFVPKTTFKDLFVNYVVSNSNVNIIEYRNPGIPNYLLEMDFLSAFSEKAKFIIKRGTFAWLRFALVTKLVLIFSRFFCRSSDFILVAGSKYIPEKNKKIIAANSFDYASYLNYNNVGNESELYKDCIVFVDTGSPLFDTDSLLMRNTHPLTVSKWYPSIREYFDNLERLTSLEIVIAAHPKHKYNNKTNKIFGNRRIIHGKTQEIIRNSKMVLIRNSTAVSFAVIYNKPIIIMYSDELLKDDNTFYKDIKFWSEELFCPFINIDHPSFPNKYEQFPRINKKAYTEYKLKYLTSRVDNKTNCEVIMDEIVNNENNF